MKIFARMKCIRPSRSDWVCSTGYVQPSMLNRVCPTEYAQQSMLNQLYQLYLIEYARPSISDRPIRARSKFFHQKPSKIIRSTFNQFSPRNSKKNPVRLSPLAEIENSPNLVKIRSWTEFHLSMPFSELFFY